MLPVGRAQRATGQHRGGADVAGFGERTRRLMVEGGVSLRELARRTHYDPGHLSKVLAGRKPVSHDLAARVDGALRAGGELARLARPAGLESSGCVLDDAERLAFAARHPRRVDSATAGILAGTLAHNRRLEDTIGSGALLEPTVSQLWLIENLVAEARGPARPSLVDVAAQWAQFAGWLHANSGKHDAGASYYDRALEWATEAGNVDMVSEALSLKGQQAWTLGRVGPVIGLSQAAQRDRNAYPGQHAISAAQEARGHAMAGDRVETDRKLDAAMRLVAEAGEHGRESPPWLYYHSPAFFALQRGLAHRYLAHQDPGRNTRAVELLATGLNGLDAEERGSEWAADYAYQLAVAHAEAGEPDAACAVAGEAADVARGTRSSRLTGQLRALHVRLAGRWSDVPEVAELGERLAVGVAGDVSGRWET